MTLYDQQQAAADVQGMKDAEYRHAPHVDLPAYFEGRDRKGDVAPYVSQPEQPKDLTPIAVGAVKVVGAVAVVAIMGKVFVVGVTTVFLIIEANAMYAVAAVVGGVALFGLSAARSSGSSSENPTYSNRRGGADLHNHYYQNNSFGGSANQTNQ